MPKFDIPGRVDDTLVVTVSREYREHDFKGWPYETEDPAEIEILTSYGAYVVKEAPPKPKPLPEAEAKPFPHASKEVVDSVNRIE